MTAPLHPSFQDVESGYRAFYVTLINYIDDAGAAVPQDLTCSLDVDLCDIWDRFESRCSPCPECDCFPCRCEVAP